MTLFLERRPDNGEFREIFEVYGADYNSTMARFMGKEAMYLKFLDMLFKDDNLEKLGTALEQQDYEAAFAAAHTLKGVVGNMGLTPLFNAVCAIVESLRKREVPEDYNVLYQIIQTGFLQADEFRKKLKEGRQS